jgi:hypothetical protein
MRQLRQIRNQIVQTYSFVVDGETEIWYLQMLKRNERQLKLNIEPKLPQRKSIDEHASFSIDEGGGYFVLITYFLIELYLHPSDKKLF